MPTRSGTRVPFRSLIDYLEQGFTLAEFLEDFPTVKREQAVAALEEAGEIVEANARSGVEAENGNRKSVRGRDPATAAFLQRCC